MCSTVLENTVVYLLQSTAFRWLCKKNRLLQTTITFAYFSLQSLIIGFSFFKMENSAQGLQNQVDFSTLFASAKISNSQQMFAIFVFLFVVFQLIYQIMPNFVVQRTLYEARERQSKTYMWQAFLFSNVFIEMFWNVVSLWRQHTAKIQFPNRT